MKSECINHVAKRLGYGLRKRNSACRDEGRKAEEEVSTRRREKADGQGDHQTSILLPARHHAEGQHPRGRDEE